MNMFPRQRDASGRRGPLGRYGRGRSATRRGNGNVFSVNIAPMIDMTFLLLVFFLVTTTFEHAEGILDSKLPRELGEKTVALPLSPIVIHLRQVGPDIDDVEITLDGVEQKPANEEELTAFIEQLHDKPGFDRSTPVVIVSEQSVRWDHVVACWNAALRAGSERIAFGGS